MQKLAEICVRRPVFATVLILVLGVFGWFGYTHLGVDRFPKVDFPTISIITVLPGAAPEEIETEVSDKIEEAVNTVSGIDELRSVSSEGVSQVFVVFVLEKDADIAAQEVRDRVNRILSDLPKSAEQPRIEKFDPDSVPVMQISVSAPLPIKDLTEYSDKVLRRQLESVNGVGQVRVVGGQKRQINVVLDPLKLRSQNLTVTDVANALARENMEVPGGSIKQGAKEITLRTLGRVGSVEDMALIPVREKEGHTVTIADVGAVEDTTEEASSLASHNDTQSVLLSVRKQSGTNTIEVADRVKERLADITARVPKDYRIQVVQDQSVFVRAAVGNVKEHLFLGSLLAAVVVLVFLANARTTLIAALAIPTSIISTFALMWYMGFTLNILTLLALTLSVGIVIDDAIVVLENIFRFIEEKMHRPFDAAIAATKEIGPAVMAITLSLIAVFMPVGFMTGIIGRFMRSFGLTMSFAIMVSLFVSFTLTPMLAARWLRAPGRQQGRGSSDPGQVGAPEGEPGGSKKRGFYHVIETAYLALLRFCMRFRWLVVAVCVVALASIPFLAKRIPKNFLPDEDESEYQVNVRAPEGTSLEATHALLNRIARDLRGLSGVEYTITSTGSDEASTPNSGSVLVRMAPMKQRRFSQMQMMDYVRREVLPRYTEYKLRTSVSPVAAMSGGGHANAQIQYLISGPDINKLSQYAEQIKSKLSQVPGAVDIDSSLVVGKPQYGVVVDRAKAAKLGVSVSDVATSLRLLVAGDKVSDYNEGGEQYEVHVRATPERRSSIEGLDLVTVPSTRLGSVPLADVVKFKEGTGPSQIDRLNRRREVTITANLTPGTSQQGVLSAIDRIIADLHMGPDYRTGVVGQSKELGRTATAFGLTFLMSFVFMYLVIAAQFESWLHPITILLSLPLTLPFALLSLLLFGQSLNIMSTLGVLVLFAVVKKNAILQIDHTNQLRAAGMPRNEAILRANADRLRPILMTTIAFVAGMMPLLLSQGSGSGTNHSISSVIIGGQTLSLLLTLVATPVAYSLFDDMARVAREMVAWVRGRRWTAHLGSS